MMTHRGLARNLLLLVIWGLFYLPATVVAGEAQFRIGAGIYDVTGPAAELGMMGYSMPDQKTAGIHMRLYSRAYVIASPDNSSRVVFVSADIQGMMQSVTMGVLEKLADRYGSLYTKENVMLSATHTHSGPGGYSGYTIYDLAVLGFDVQNYTAIVEGIFQSIVRAHNNLAPGVIKINEGDVANGGMQRSETAYAQNPDKDNYAADTDTLMTLLRLERPDGTEIGMINWFAVHPTSIGNTNRLISGDNKGFASYQFEASRGTDYLAQETFVAAFAQSNAGDVSPNLWGHPDGENDYARMEIIANRQLSTADDLYSTAAEQVTGPLDYRHTYIDFSETGPVYTQDRACVSAIGMSKLAGSSEDGAGIDGFTEGLVFGDNWPGITLVPEDQACHGEKVILIPTGRMDPIPWTPQVLPVQIIRIGTLALVGVPFECTTMVGRHIREAVHNVLSASGVTRVVLAGYANAYSSYITTAPEYRVQHYEGASTHFGEYSETVLKEEILTLAQAMVSGAQVSPGPEPEDIRDDTITLITGVVFDDKPLFKSFGDVVTNADASYIKGATAKAVFWGAHPKNNLRTQGTFLEIQKYSGDTWTVIARDNAPNTRYHWERSGVANSRVTIEWDIPGDADPGTYRIVQYGDWKSGWTGRIEPYVGVSREFTVY
ncbi:MAG: neutral/alkaline ceramidase [Desulfobacterales bacterium]|nr:neutral/alkaline ceramidase [Desulfobacterales bacterium]